MVVGGLEPLQKLDAARPDVTGVALLLAQIIQMGEYI
jgi:hypothetical protein